MKEEQDIMRGPPFERSLAAQEGALRARNIRLKYQEEACKVYAQSGTKIWFLCTKCDHKYEAMPNNISKGHGCPFCVSKKLCGNEECQVCWEKSLASREDDLAARCLKYSGDKDARTVFVNQHQKMLFTCTRPECNHDFEAAPGKINTGRGCPFCSSPPQKLCGDKECLACWQKSLASKADDLAAKNLLYSGSEDARTVFISSNTKTLFTCTRPECGHDFKAVPSDVNAGKGCPFCSSPPQKLCGGECPVCWQKSLASKEDDLVARGIKCIVDDASRVFSSSHTKLVWQCLDPACGSTWRAMANSVCHSKQPSGCPGCGRHKTERMVSEYVKSVWGGGDALRADWCRGPTGRYLPYDIYVEIESMGIIFEVDGEQHFGQHSHFNRTRSYEEILAADRYKQSCAMENGRHVVRMRQVDVLFGRIDWQAAVHNAVQECLASDRPLLLFIAADTSCYNKHM